MEETDIKGTILVSREPAVSWQVLTGSGETTEGPTWQHILNMPLHTNSQVGKSPGVWGGGEKFHEKGCA